MTDQPPNQQEPDDGGQLTPFAAVLEQINNGDLADQLAVDMRDLVNAVRDLGRKGALTLKVEVAPRKGSAIALNVTARRELKLPQEEPIESVFFADEKGGLHRDDPRQMSFPLRSLDKPPAGELRKAGQ